MSDPLRLLVLARDASPRVRAVWEELRPVLARRRKLELLGVAETDAPGFAPPPETELILVIGGDGAILRACRSLGNRQLPILGVNAGRLGFLADLSLQEFRQQLPRIEARDYAVARHLMFACEHQHADGRVDRHLGLNEAALLAGGALQMIDIRLEIDGRDVTTYSGDGLIISTPVGSTAHSLSAGGPILRQDLQAFVVTPICPHTLTVRPLVDAADCVYRLTAPQAPPGVMLVIDGQIKTPFLPEDAVVLRRADVEFQLARVPGHSFYGALHQKLGWAGHPRYQQR